MWWVKWRTFNIYDICKYDFTCLYSTCSILLVLSHLQLWPASLTFWNWSKNILKHIIFSLFSLFSIQVILQWLSVWAIKLTSCRDIMLAFNMHFKVGFNLWAVSTFIRLFDGHGINQRINLKQFSFHVFYLCDSAKTFCLGNKTDIFNK